MNAVALLFRFASWTSRVRDTVGPDRFDRVAGFLLRWRRAFAFLVGAVAVAVPATLLAVFVSDPAIVVAGILLWTGALLVTVRLVARYVERLTGGLMGGFVP